MFADSKPAIPNFHIGVRRVPAEDRSGGDRGYLGRNMGSGTILTETWWTSTICRPPRSPSGSTNDLATNLVSNFATVDAEIAKCDVVCANCQDA